MRRFFRRPTVTEVEYKLGGSVRSIDLRLKELEPQPVDSCSDETCDARELFRKYGVESETKPRNEVLREHIDSGIVYKTWVYGVKLGVLYLTGGRPVEPKASERCHVGKKIPVLGSDNVSVCSQYDIGFPEAVLAAYNNHWDLRTCPEDWWYCVVQKVARAVDDHSKSDNVRKFFVNHNGKKMLTVNVGPSINSTDYSWLFDQMAGKINDQIKVPGYVETMTSDFSITTPEHRIISQIAIMTSVQEYFDYEIACCCGIPSIEMSGQFEDWTRLITKFRALKKIMKPISKEIELNKWWCKAESVLKKLVKTYQGKPDKSWWSKIIGIEGHYVSGAPPPWTGWFITDFLGEHDIRTTLDLKTGLVTVPMTVTDVESNTSEPSALVAGIAGYKIIQEDKIPVVEAHHGWVMMLEPDSNFRANIEVWEASLNYQGG